MHQSIPGSPYGENYSQPAGASYGRGYGATALYQPSPQLSAYPPGPQTAAYPPGPHPHMFVPSPAHQAPQVILVFKFQFDVKDYLKQVKVLIMYSFSAF